MKTSSHFSSNTFVARILHSLGHMSRMQGLPAVAAADDEGRPKKVANGGRKGPRTAKAASAAGKGNSAKTATIDAKLVDLSELDDTESRWRPCRSFSLR